MHSWTKHQKEFASIGIQNRAQYAAKIEETLLFGEAKALKNGRSAYRNNDGGVIVFRDRNTPDGVPLFARRVATVILRGSNSG